MYCPKTKVFRTEREKIVSEILEALELNSEEINLYREDLINKVKKGELF
jgi:hypothetical protein